VAESQKQIRAAVPALLGTRLYRSAKWQANVGNMPWHSFGLAVRGMNFIAGLETLRPDSGQAFKMFDT
jgi:hypothetical protein